MPDRSSPLPPLVATTAPRGAIFGDWILRDAPYRIFEGLPSEALTRVIGTDALRGEDGVMWVEAADGQRWQVGADMVKRQLIRDGVNINAVFLWESLSLSERAILRALAFEPARTIGRQYLHDHNIRLVTGETANNIMEKLVAGHGLVVKDDDVGYRIGSDFVQRWVRRMGRPTAGAGLPDAIADEAEALQVVVALEGVHRRVMRALTFEPTGEFTDDYCQAHDLTRAEAAGALTELKRDGRLVEFNHNDEFCVRGRVLRRAVKAEYSEELRRAGSLVSTEEEAAALFMTLSPREMAVVRAASFRPGALRDADYRHAMNLREAPGEIDGAVDQLKGRQVVVVLEGRPTVPDPLLRAWVRGNLERPAHVEPSPFDSDRRVIGVMNRIRKYESEPLVRGLGAEDVRIEQITAAYIAELGVEPAAGFRTLGLLLLDLELLRVSEAGAICFRDSRVGAVMRERYQFVNVEAAGLDLQGAASRTSLVSQEWLDRVQTKASRAGGERVQAEQAQLL